MVGHVIAARENCTRVAYEADGQYGYLDVTAFATSLRLDDIIEGDIGTLGRKRVSINGGEPHVEVQICDYGISRAKAIKEYESVHR